MLLELNTRRLQLSKPDRPAPPNPWFFHNPEPQLLGRGNRMPKRPAGDVDLGLGRQQLPAWVSFHRLIVGHSCETAHQTVCLACRAPDMAPPPCGSIKSNPYLLMPPRVPRPYRCTTGIASLRAIRFGIMQGEVMAIQVSLYHGEKKAGTVAFRSLLLTKPDDYTCDPTGILDAPQLQALAAKLCRLPAIRFGTVRRKSRWQED